MYEGSYKKSVQYDDDYLNSEERNGEYSSVALMGAHFYKIKIMIQRINKKREPQN